MTLDTGYTDNFFRELSPVWLNYVAAVNGHAPRDLSRPFTYLELGCGFGSSALVNAAAFPLVELHACDLNPAHIEQGRRYAAELGTSNIEFHQASFEELLRCELPAFDFIVAHGVYSWVGAGERQTVRRIVREKLKPGGIVYLSYNCMPGWAPEAPLRRLLAEIAGTASGDSQRRAAQALQSVRDLGAAKLQYFTANPDSMAALESYAKRPASYLPYEFLAADWELFYSIDVADEMADAGVAYAGSATLPDNHDSLIIDAAAAAAIAKLPGARQRSLATDFAANRRFRRDVFIGTDVDAHASRQRVDVGSIPVGYVGNPDFLSARVRVPRGQLSLQEDFIEEVRALVSRASLPMRDLVDALAAKGGARAEIVRNLLYLVAAGTLTPFAVARDSGAAASVRGFANARVERAVRHIIERRTRGAIASEILGNGVEIAPLEAMAVVEFLAGAQETGSLSMRLEEGIRRLELDGSADPGVQARASAEQAVRNLIPGLMRLHLLV